MEVVGIVNVISLGELKIITYVMKDFELALAQATELLKFVDYKYTIKEERESNGMRRMTYTSEEIFEILVVQEIEVGYEVLEVKK